MDDMKMHQKRSQKVQNWGNMLQTSLFSWYAYMSPQSWLHLTFAPPLTPRIYNTCSMTVTCCIAYTAPHPRGCAPQVRHM